MQIEVGDYVRTVDGQIGKVRMVTNNMLFINGNQYYYTINDILKCSKNIVDLIKPKDYVNGKCVEEINQYEAGKFIITLLAIIHENDIKTIVTKEQFESIEYKNKI